jgi:hypothetical protein
VAAGQQHFLGDPVSMVLPDRRDGTLYAALNLGHFGAKLHRRDAGSSDWVEVAAPAFPVKPVDSTDPVEWTVGRSGRWRPAGRTSRACCGPAPAGRPVPLGDRGDSWQLVDALWKVPERAQWMGGGYDVPGIHSICVDPRDSRSVLVGILRRRLADHGWRRQLALRARA